MIKKLFFLLLTSLSINAVNAQQAELLNTNWYAYKVTSQGVDYFAPSNTERFNWQQNNKIEFKYDQVANAFTSHYCVDRTYAGITIKSPNVFEISNQILSSTMLCKDIANTDFMSVYYKVLDVPSVTDVVYQVSNVNQNDLELILEMPSGDKVYFINALLGVKSTLFNNVKLYPNPVQDVLNFDLSSVSLGNYAIHFFDVSGKKVKQAVLNASNVNSIDTSDLKAGYYIVHIVNDKGTLELTEKILKN